MKSGWNPRKRSRNIGTSKQGHGRNNRLVISDHLSEGKIRLFYERLEEPVTITRCVGRAQFIFVVEPTRSGFAHACTIDDLVHVLERIPVADLEGLQMVLLRQPKKKEVVLSRVWGRLCFVEIGQHDGWAVIIEAQEPDKEKKWGTTSATPAEALELDRLRADGHIMLRRKRQLYLKSTIDSVRATQLYRTLPHEVGHNVHHLMIVEKSLKDPEDDDERYRLEELYDAIPTTEKETFAHTYARKLLEKLSLEGVIPFERKFNEEKIIAEGMNPDWFGAR